MTSYTIWLSFPPPFSFPQGIVRLRQLENRRGEGEKEQGVGRKKDQSEGKGVARKTDEERGIEP